MAKLKNSLGSIVLLVAFLVLTAMATILYGGNAEHKAKMEKTFFYQKTNLVLSYVWVAATSLVGINLNKNVGLNQSIQDDLAMTDNNLDGVQPDFWSRTVAKIKTEWEKGDSADQSVPGADIDNFLSWQKTETGGELIFRLKNGGEYKLPLPFKFLNK